MSRKQKRQRFTSQKKAAIVRRHLADKVSVADLCDEYGIQPSTFYGWQKQVLDNLEGLFESTKGGARAKAAHEGQLRRKDEKIAELEARIVKKDSVIATISEMHIELKKGLGVS